jgi:hypothetical protein
MTQFVSSFKLGNFYVVIVVVEMRLAILAFGDLTERKAINENFNEKR